MAQNTHSFVSSHLRAPEITTSTFGWTLATEAPSTLLLVGFRGPASKTGWAPLFTIGCTASTVESLNAALAAQTLQDAYVLAVDGDLTGFVATYGRYALWLHDASAFSARLHADPRLLVRLMVVLLRYEPVLLYVTVNGAIVGVCMDRLVFMGRWMFPKLVGLRADLHAFAGAVGELGVYALDRPLSAPDDARELSPSPTGTDACGYWGAPLARPETAADREAILAMLQACPEPLVYAKGRTPLWTCGANEWYGHGEALRRYVGLEPPIQIYGKIQHGWQSGCGIDGERGYKPEARQLGFPIFVWNRRNAAAARADGLERTIAIGAPFLYLGSSPDPGPAGRSLLCFPYHSVPEYPLAADWQTYADELHAIARRNGFSDVTVCLHHYDTQTGARTALRAAGIEVVTLGHPDERGFMDRLTMLVRQHAAVTSDRICTAGLYAEVLGRPFFVSGEALYSDPPDPDVGLGADREWIAREMPEFLAFDGQTHRDVALRELGAEFKREPEALRQLLWGWML